MAAMFSKAANLTQGDGQNVQLQNTLYASERYWQQNSNSRCPCQSAYRKFVLCTSDVATRKGKTQYLQIIARQSVAIRAERQLREK